MIETKRLFLRKYTVNDFDTLYEIMSEREDGDSVEYVHGIRIPS